MVACPRCRAPRRVAPNEPCPSCGANGEASLDEPLSALPALEEHLPAPKYGIPATRAWVALALAGVGVGGVLALRAVACSDDDHGSVDAPDTNEPIATSF